MAKLPTISELTEENPGVDISNYGAHLMLNAPKTPSFLAYEAKMKRKRAQPLYRLKFNHYSMVASIAQLAEFLNHPSPRVQDRARAILMEVSSRAQALAEAGDDLEDVVQGIMGRAMELM